LSRFIIIPAVLFADNIIISHNRIIIGLIQGAKMEKFHWKEEYSVGIEKIDRQHQHLFELVNNLIDRSGSTDDVDLTSQMLTEMVNYAKEHFTDEENLMKEYGYPETESHTNQHTYFIDTTAELVISFIENRKTTIDEIEEFLQLWLTTHILKSDMKYRDFFKARIPAKVS
jgi:hemerythrin